MPLMQLSTLVLPAPFGPISASNSPGSTANETLSSTVRPPKRRLRVSTARSAIPPPRPAILLDVAIGPALAAGLPEIELLHVLMALEPLAVAVKHDAAVLHDIGVVRDLECDGRTLLDHQDGDAEFVADRAQPAREIADNNRSQAARKLADQQEQIGRA